MDEILDPGLADPWASACHVVTWGTWGLFAIDYAVRLLAARDRWRFVRAHPWDLAVVVLPLLLFLAALAALDAERGHEEANLTTFGDALWWALATVTTVGYGDG